MILISLGPALTPLYLYVNTFYIIIIIIDLISLVNICLLVNRYLSQPGRGIRLSQRKEIHYVLQGEGACPRNMRST
jgi:hypothetical protein